jgi:hypothetical protein
MSQNANLAKKPNAMCERIDHEYAEFESAMDEGMIYTDEHLSFNDICSIIGADPNGLELKIAEELGYLGDELLEVYREKSLL